MGSVKSQLPHCGLRGSLLVGTRPLNLTGEQVRAAPGKGVWLFYLGLPGIAGLLTDCFFLLWFGVLFIRAPHPLLSDRGAPCGSALKLWLRRESGPAGEGQMKGFP